MLRRVSDVRPVFHVATSSELQASISFDLLEKRYQVVSLRND